MIKSAPPVVLAFLLGAVFSFGAAEATSSSARLDRLVDEVYEDIADVRALASTTGNQQLRRQLYREISDLEASVGELEDSLDVMIGPPPAVVVSPEEFSRIHRAVAAESFGSDQLAVLHSASSGRRFTTAQVTAIMELFSFSDDRVEAAVMLYPRVADPQNWYTVYGALTFSSDREALRQRTR